MAVSDDYLDFIRDRFDRLGYITIRRMFGGAGVYCDGIIFALVADNVLYLKVDDSNRGDYEDAGSEPFRPYGDDGGAMSYYEVPVDVLEDDDRLLAWARKAMVVGAKRKKRR